MGASIFVAGLTGRLPFDQPITVRNRGGLVRASASADGMVTLSGNATFEWSGSVTVEDGRARDLIVTERRADEIDAWARI